MVQFKDLQIGDWFTTSYFSPLDTRIFMKVQCTIAGVNINAIVLYSDTYNDIGEEYHFLDNVNAEFCTEMLTDKIMARYPNCRKYTDMYMLPGQTFLTIGYELEDGDYEYWDGITSKHVDALYIYCHRGTTSKFKIGDTITWNVPLPCGTMIYNTNAFYDTSIIFCEEIDGDL